MKKYLIILTGLIILSSCKSRKTRTMELLATGVELEMSSAGNNDGHHVEAKEDSLPRLAALFSASSESHSIKLKRTQELFEGRYGYDVTSHIQWPDIYFDDDNFVNIGLAIAQEKEHMRLFEAILSGLPRKKSEELKEFITEALEESRQRYELFNKTANIYNSHGNDHELPESYTVCRNCGKLYVGDTVTECDVCGTIGRKLYVVRAEDFPAPEMLHE